MGSNLFIQFLIIDCLSFRLVGTGDYHARAQPSAGPIHFAQSFMCTAQNECLNYTNYEEVPSFANAR